MNVIIVGCGRVGSELAYRLFLNGHQVTIVDRHSEAFKNLPSDFRGRTLEGDAPSEAVLHRAGIETAQAVAAVTSSDDSLNGVIGHGIASDIYHIPARYSAQLQPALARVAGSLWLAGGWL